MRRTAWLTAAACAAGLTVGAAKLLGANGQSPAADSGEHRPCDELTIRGDYGAQRERVPPPAV